MYIDRKKLLEKLENHSKLLSMISDKSLPIKEVLLHDVKEMKNCLELSMQQK